MKAIIASRYPLSISAALAFLAGCGGLQPPIGAPGTMTPASALVTHEDRGKSWMLPGKTSDLMYVGSFSTGNVYVYDYESGSQVGTLTGLDGPYGMCVDAKGDVYVANFNDGTAVEYAHGGTAVLNTFNAGGEPIGCSVNRVGDVAVTSFSPGEVTIYSRGDPQKGMTYYNSTCELLFPMGYDDKGNLVGMGESGSGTVACALFAGSKTLQTIPFDYGHYKVYSPGGTMWDGKFLAITDQEAGGDFETGVVEAKVKGRRALVAVGSTTFTDDCEGNYADVVNPFIVGKKNTPVSDTQGRTMVGVDLFCEEASASAVRYWRYPAGGMSYRALASPPEDPYGVAVSIGT